MYAYSYDTETGGLLLNTSPLRMSNEPRPVYYQELDILGFDKFWNYDKDDRYPLMWAEANNYYYRGRLVAKTKGGSVYTAPEIEIIEAPEPEGKKLLFVDIPAMVKKNEDIIEKLAQDTIKRIYNTYVEYKNKVDIFYVAFSGGKDSIVTLDLAQKALPHNNFLVLFGDTGMEFSDTYDVIEKTKLFCNEAEIRFYRSCCELSPAYTWNIIGPPAQKLRWCCGVHKTAPQILLLRRITKNPHFRGMAMMGVRADESVTRNKYKELSLGGKHQGQYDYYPILHWNSAELYLYIYKENLILNETYKKGNSRAGCLVCPMAAPKNTWFKEQCYAGSPTDEHSTTFYNNIIIDKTIAHDLPEQKLSEFMNIGVWKSRHNGNKLFCPNNLYHEERNGDDYVIVLDSESEDWKEWLKTIGKICYVSDNVVSVCCDENQYTIEYKRGEKGNYLYTIKNVGNSQKEILFLSWIKIVLKKTAYCMRCHVCEANCPNGFIHMENGEFHIDDSCIKCKKCYKVNGGCLVAASQLLPKEGNKMNGSVDQYKNMGIQYAWVVEYLNKANNFWENNTLGSQMVTSLTSFLKHSGISEKKKITPFGELVARIGGETTTAWALMICNLVYTPQFMWWVKNIDFSRPYFHAEIDDMLKELSLTDNSRKNIISAFKNIFNSNPILSGGLGVGIVSTEMKGKNTYLVDVIRKPWVKPEPKVILYSLYKFAEACGDYYQFTLSRLLDHDIDADGVSPTEIFGIDRDTMQKIVNGLSVNYPEFISVSFTLNLENITLNSEKSSKDVLELF